MATKLSFLIGVGAGYVLGARSGRERYDQIADKAREILHHPRVQETADQAQQVMQEKAGQARQVMQEKMGSTTSSNGGGTIDETASTDAGTTGASSTGRRLP
jgi:hypothetical protein